MKLDGDLYVYPWRSLQENNSNSYLIKGEVTLLIDPGHQHLVKNLINRLGKDGHKVEDIGLIISTHAHPDHFEGGQIFAQAGALTALHQEEEKFLLDVGREFYAAFGLEMPEFKIDFYLKEGELKLGSKIFQILHTPGHSPGSISIYWPEKKALFTGDVIFAMGVGRTDLPGGDGSLLRNSIERLANLDVELLLPGHGEIVKGKKNIARNFAYIRTNFFDYL